MKWQTRFRPKRLDTRMLLTPGAGVPLESPPRRPATVDPSLRANHRARLRAPPSWVCITPAQSSTVTSRHKAVNSHLYTIRAIGDRSRHTEKGPERKVVVVGIREP